MARLAALALLFALSPAQLRYDPAAGIVTLATAVAHADEGGDNGGENGGENGGDSGGDNGGDNGGDDGNGGEDNGGDDGGDDNGGDDNGGEDGDDDHGEAGSSVKGFLGALVGHGRINSSFADDDTVILVFADGWSEKVDKGRYQLIDRKGRVVISRKARTSDEKRLRAAIGG